MDEEHAIGPIASDAETQTIVEVYGPDGQLLSKTIYDSKVLVVQSQRPKTTRSMPKKLEGEGHG